MSSINGRLNAFVQERDAKAAEFRAPVVEKYLRAVIDGHELVLGKRAYSVKVAKGTAGGILPQLVTVIIDGKNYGTWAVYMTEAFNGSDDAELKPAFRRATWDKVLGWYNTSKVSTDSLSYKGAVVTEGVVGAVLRDVRNWDIGYTGEHESWNPVVETTVEFDGIEIH